MSGIPEYNAPQFRAAAACLRDQGYDVVSPVELDEAEGLDYATLGDITPGDEAWSQFLARDIQCIARDDIDTVVALQGWQDSRGASLEVATAWGLGKEVLRYPELTPIGSDEVRVVDATTGGAKGQKLARFDLLPWPELWEVAKLYGKGAEKYEDRNWERGYRWGLSFAALHRHLAQFWQGESVDAQTGCHHLASVVFHAFALMRFEKQHAELDDRATLRLG